MIRVVVIDDDAMVRTGLKLILGGDTGLEIVGEADNGDTGLSVVDDTNPDVVLLDIRMPVLDGLGFLERLPGRTPTPAVIVLTTFNTDDYVLRALRAGARGFLLKDADPPRMIEAINAVHRGDPVLAPSVTETLIASATGSRPHPVQVPGIADLTEREREVARLLASGRTNSEIGERLYLSLATVKANVTRIFTKLGVDNRVSAAMLIRDAGL